MERSEVAVAPAASRAGGVDAGMSWLQALPEPERALDWSLHDWNRVVRLARRHRLLARLACCLESAGLLDRIPPPVKPHLRAAQVLSRARSGAMLWAIERLPDMVGPLDHPMVLLKGSAYMGQDLSIAAGRLPSDLDILVPKSRLPGFRATLRQAGWEEPALDEHDERYYLEWSHELPPMQHRQLPIELDVHHNILPQRSGRVPDADQLLARAQPSRWPAWQVLHPADQLLHSAGHLFHDAEPRDRVRDLVDMDGLVRHFGRTPGFFADLSLRAEQMHLQEPLALACHFLRAWMATPMPADLGPWPGHGAASQARKRFLVALMDTTLRPSEPDDRDSLGKRTALTLVLARYHFHRLPLRHQIPHVWHKWRQRPPQGEPMVDPTLNAP